MKAYLLAAGLGTRLTPLTESTPKCLLPVGGEPLLGRWLRACARYGVEEALINTHHLAEKVWDYVREAGQRYGVSVRLLHEEILLGSAGTVRAARDFAAGEESFFIIYADNASEVDLGRMAAWHARHEAVMTVGLFRAPRPERCGIAVVDAAGLIVDFVEKPAKPGSPWAAAGLFVARAGLFNWLDRAWEERPPDHPVLDFGYDVLPRIAAAGEACGYMIEEYLVDIGTPEGYRAADERFLRASPPEGLVLPSRWRPGVRRQSSHG